MHCMIAYTQQKAKKNSQLQTITDNSKKNKGMRMIKQITQSLLQAMPIQKLHLNI